MFSDIIILAKEIVPDFVIECCPTATASCSQEAGITKDVLCQILPGYTFYGINLTSCSMFSLSFILTQ